VATFEDVQRIASGLAGVVADDPGTAFRVDGKLFAWPWLERVHPRKARIPNLGVLNVRIASEMDKDVLIGMDPKVFFTEPHFDGYAMIQVRLDAVGEALLRKLIEDSWRLAAPKRLRAAAADHTGRT
jgi:hypothetical protein